MTRAWTPIALVAAALIGACTQVGSDPLAVVALQFDTLPYPAIVAGDTLRNETGAAVPLTAVALNSDGNAIPSAGISFLMLDSGASITAGGFVVSGHTAVTSLRVIAQAGSLQSRPLVLFVTPRPDSIAGSGTVDTLRYAAIDGTTNTSTPISVKLLSNSVSPAALVRGWIVRFSLEHDGAPLSSTNATVAWLVDDNNRRSTEDTTDIGGLASRRLRFNSNSVGVESHLEDSVTVIATAIARGAPLAGSPVRIVIQLRAR